MQDRNGVRMIKSKEESLYEVHNQNSGTLGYDVGRVV